MMVDEDYEPGCDELDENQELIETLDKLAHMELAFRENPTFTLAREIWLFCYEHELKVSDAVEARFVAQLKSDAGTCTPLFGRRRAQGKKKMKDLHLHCEINTEIDKQKKIKLYAAKTRAYGVVAARHNMEEDAVKRWHHNHKKKKET